MAEETTILYFQTFIALDSDVEIQIEFNPCKWGKGSFQELTEDNAGQPVPEKPLNRTGVYSSASEARFENLSGCVILTPF